MNSADFKKGLFIGLGVMAALVIVSFASGLITKK